MGMGRGSDYMKTSIVVPAFNAEETLANCLTAIFAAIAERNDCEVIVVDDGSADRTPEIAQRFPVRLIVSKLNEGRIRAREKGARAAKSQKLLFVDSRVLIPSHALNTLESLDYEPVMAGAVTLGTKKESALDRLLYLVRRRIYESYGTQAEPSQILRITPENFDRMPKGTTCFYVDKSRFLEALPEERGRYVNDDTRLLALIVNERDILASRELSVEYIQRAGYWEALLHIYDRGPRFADYYLRPGKRYYAWWIACCLFLISAVLATVFVSNAGVWIAILSLLSLLTISFRLAEHPRDLLTVFVMLPAVSLFFGLGILKGKLLRFRKAPAKTWNRRLAVLLVITAGIIYYILGKEDLKTLRITRWELLPLLAGIHLAFLAANGLILKTFVKIFEVPLRPKEWFGLAAMTAMGSYLASSAGGMTLRAVVLKHKFDFSYSKFLTVLTAHYLINAIVAAIIGLSAWALYYGHIGPLSGKIPLFFAAAGGIAGAFALFRPRLPVGKGRARELVNKIYKGWDILRGSPRTLGKVGILLTVNLLLQTLSLLVGFAVFSISLEPLPALLIAALSSFSIFIALTPANLGIQECVTGFVSFLVGYGFHYGLAAVAVSRAVAMVNILLLGPAFSYVLLKEKPWGANGSAD
jgi:glycosyltransferase involved in cell wall biosynthesis/uncharacterized membrane protein YbhN (UPF0104 family)